MDHYKNHIAHLSKEHNIAATADICNQQGQLLVPEGHTLEQNAIDKIVKFKLQKPIEQTVAIQSEITADSLFEILTDYMESSNDLFTISSKSKISIVLKNCCYFACKSSLVRQKLTVLSLEYSGFFCQTLFVASFTAHIYCFLKKTAQEINQAFLAAILRDLGLLHIDPEILSSKGELSEEHWRQLTSHPIISKSIGEGVEYADNICLRGVLEHHENVDGTGFPVGKKGAQLEELGQILNMLDSAYAVYRKSYLPLKRNIADIVPVIQINSRPQISAPFNALISLLKLVSPTEHNVIDNANIKEVVNTIKVAYVYISSYVNLVYKIVNEFVKSTKGPQLVALQKTYLHIHKNVTQSGLINEAYLRWLEQVEKERIEASYREAEDVYMMMKEVAYHIDKAKTQLTQYIAEEGSNHISERVPDLFDQLMTPQKPDFKTLNEF